MDYQGFILEFQLGGGGGNDMLVLKQKPSRGVWGHAPPEIFLFLRALRLQFRPLFFFTNCSQHFKGGGGGGRTPRAPPPKMTP